MNFSKLFLLLMIMVLSLNCAVQNAPRKNMIQAMMPGRGPVKSRVILNTSVKQEYPANPIKEISPFRVVHIWAPTGEKTIKKDSKPEQEYDVLGTIEFSENWYGEKEIHKLVNEAVASIGGDGVLEFTCSAIGTIYVRMDDLVPADDYYHESFSIVVIRFKQQSR